MRRHRGFFTALIIAFLIATTHRVPAPIREIEETPKPAAPTKTKTESKNSGKQASESGMRSHSVTVVFTDNTRASMLYLKNNYEGKPFTDVRTGEILERLRQALSTRFSNVSISESSSNSRSGGLTMLFDLQAHVGSISFTANTLSLTATFKDGGRPLQTISASGKSTVPYPAFSNGFSKAVERVFADFSQKLAVVH
jgi:hypothetical protein